MGKWPTSICVCDLCLHVEVYMYTALLKAVRRRLAHERARAKRRDGRSKHADR